MHEKKKHSPATSFSRRRRSADACRPTLLLLVVHPQVTGFAAQWARLCGAHQTTRKSSSSVAPDACAVLGHRRCGAQGSHNHALALRLGVAAVALLAKTNSATLQATLHGACLAHAAGIKVTRDSRIAVAQIRHFFVVASH